MFYSKKLSTLSAFLVCFYAYRGASSSDFCCFGERLRSVLSTLLVCFVRGRGRLDITSVYIADRDVEETSELFPTSVFPNKD